MRAVFLEAGTKLGLKGASTLQGVGVMSLVLAVLKDLSVPSRSEPIVGMLIIILMVRVIKVVQTFYYLFRNVIASKLHVAIRLVIIGK